MITKLLRLLLTGMTLTLGLAAESNAQTPIQTNAAPNYFSGSVALGLTATRGNSDTTTATATVDASHKTNLYEVLLGAQATYGRSSGVLNSENIDGHGQYNFFGSPRFFYGVKADALSDALAGIDYRLTVAPLAGYYFIKTTNMSLAGEVGPAGVLQKLGDGTPHSYATLRAAERFEYQFSATAKLWETFEILPQVNDFKNYYWDFEIGVDAALSTHWSLRTFLDDTYYAIPAPHRLKNDAKLVAAIAYKF